MAADWIYSWFLFLFDHVIWHQKTLPCGCMSECVYRAGVWGRMSVWVLCGCLAEWMGEFTQFPSERNYILNIPWKCCGSRVLFELRGSLNQVFNPSYSKKHKKKHRYVDLQTFIKPTASSWCIILFVPGVQPQALFTFVTPRQRKLLVLMLQVLMDNVDS